MANVSAEFVEDLKYILENSLHPERLDTHPWTSSLIMQESDSVSAGLQKASPGQRLLLAFSKLFVQMMPSTPPRRGKRLDTRWCEFGLLAAEYFAPLQFGTISPASLRDAWGRIDPSILYFVYGTSPNTLTEAEKEIYKLVGHEPEVAPISTLSDWHCKGLTRLAEMIQTRENYLSKSPAEISTSNRSEKGTERMDLKKSKSHRDRKTTSLMIAALLLVGFLLVGGRKAYHVYQRALTVRQDAEDLQTLMRKDVSRLERVREAGPLLSKLQQEFSALKADAGPFLWIGPLLGWVPTHGGDLAAAPDLVILADSLLTTADRSYRVVLPLVDESADADLDLPRLTSMLLQGQPQLSEAKQTLGLARAARSRIAPEALSTEVRDLIVSDVDRILPLLEDGLAIGLELPRLLGATQEGPKTYLLLVQNEDELRPTGGFITAVGALLLQDGKISNLEFTSSDKLDDWTKPYPAAPWQLREYMNSPVLIFRDANWFTDYRTAARYAEHLYSYSSNHSVDGVIAFDQQMLVELLRVAGPIQVEGVDYPIDASNVISYMRLAKIPTAEEEYMPERNTKAFLNKITRALMDKIFSGDVELEELASVFLQALNEHHILLQIDNSKVTSVLERYRWDGAIRPPAGDFLMVLDTNVGFNKTNAVVASSLTYEIDLTRTISPSSSLTVVHTNRAVGVDACQHWDKIRAAGERDYPIQDCYWNYLRVFTPKGTFLLEATPQSIPADWMIREKSPPAQVDLLDEEIHGVQGFGTILVVPASDSRTTDFQFLLPPDVVQAGPERGQWLYRLRVQKQPGTLAVPIAIRIRLPANASVVRAPSGAVMEGTNLLLQTDLRVDLQIEVLYQTP